MNESKKRAIKLLPVAALACCYLVFGFTSSNASSNQSDPHANLPDQSGDTPAVASPSQSTAPCDPTAAKTNLWGMTSAEARCRSVGCNDCHQGIEDMHNGKVNLGCIDCHGGHAEVRLPAGAQKGSAEYKDAQNKAHVQPKLA